MHGVCTREGKLKNEAAIWKERKKEREEPGEKKKFNGVDEPGIDRREREQN